MMSILDSGDVDGTSMSPLEDVASPASVTSKLMVTDILDERVESRSNEPDGKRKRNSTDNDKISGRKVPVLSSNNNDVRFVIDDANDDGLRENDDVSLY